MAIYKVGFETTGVAQTNNAIAKTDSTARSAAQGVDITNKKLQAQQNIASQLSGGVNLLGFSFNTLFDTMTALDGRMQGAGAAIETFQSGFNDAAEAGNGMLSGLMGGFGDVVSGFRSGSLKIRALLLTSLAPIALITTGIYTLSKVWENNIGGIQTKFSKFVGKLKTMWAQFEVDFIKALNKLGPLFDTVFSTIFTIANGTIKVLVGLFKGIGAVLKPVINVFSEMGKVMSEAFGTGNQNGQVFSSIMSGLGTTLEYVGKILGWVLKIGLKPMMVTIDILGKGITKAKGLWDQFVSAFKQTAVFETVMNIFDRIREAISTMISWVEKIPGVNIPDEVKNAVNGTNNTTNNQTNNNQQININTSRPIDGSSAKGFSQRLAKELDTNN